MNASLKALDDALFEGTGGKVVRGGALTAKPDENHRRLIRIFKETQAIREEEARRREGKDWMFGEYADGLGLGDPEERETALEEMFAARACLMKQLARYSGS